MEQAHVRFGHASFLLAAMTLAGCGGNDQVYVPLGDQYVPPGDTRSPPQGDTKISTGDTHPGGDEMPPGDTHPGGDDAPPGDSSTGGDDAPGGDEATGDDGPPGDPGPSTDLVMMPPETMTNSCYATVQPGSSYVIDNLVASGTGDGSTPEVSLLTGEVPPNSVVGPDNLSFPATVAQTAGMYLGTLQFSDTTGTDDVTIMVPYGTADGAATAVLSDSGGTPYTTPPIVVSETTTTLNLDMPKPNSAWCYDFDYTAVDYCQGNLRVAIPGNCTAPTCEGGELCIAGQCKAIDPSASATCISNGEGSVKFTDEDGCYNVIGIGSATSASSGTVARLPIIVDNYVLPSGQTACCWLRLAFTFDTADSGATTCNASSTPDGKYNATIIIENP